MLKFRKLDSLRNIILDRPAAYNALNLEMINLYAPQLRAWNDSDLCKIILQTSAHPKSFCAGGDVKGIVKLLPADCSHVPLPALQFFEQEYKLNHLIATLKKPFVSLLNGIVMGGGVGLSVHGHFRVVTENTRFAMPETSIGLFPDVGGSFFLPRLDGQLGTFLGLTGYNLVGKDSFIAGIGTHFIHSDKLPLLTARLVELDTNDYSVINAVIDEFSTPISQQEMSDWALGGEKYNIINRCFKFNKVEEILQALEAEIVQNSSVVEFDLGKAQIRRGAELSIAECFQMEYSMVAQFLKTPDFIEGVDAKLISKPARNPKWNPGRENMSILTDNVVDKLFFGWEQSKTPLQLYNRLSYHEYPHRTLSGLPGVRDIQRIIHDSKEYGKVKYHKKDEILEFFKKNWGHYDKSVMGDTKVPLRNSIQGLGYERVSLEERTRLILDAHVKETKQGLELISFERSNL